MSHTMTSHDAAGTSNDSTSASHDSTGSLIKSLTEQVSTLVRSEIQLAQLELKQKGKKAGIGAGLFGGAAVFALYGGGALVACAILALALVVPAWLSALIIAILLLAVAGVAALVGKSQVQQATPPLAAVDSTKQDIRVVKESARR